MHMSVWIDLVSSPCITGQYYACPGALRELRSWWATGAAGHRGWWYHAASHRRTLNPLDTLPDPQLHHLSQYSNWTRTQQLYCIFLVLDIIQEPPPLRILFRESFQLFNFGSLKYKSDASQPSSSVWREKFMFERPLHAREWPKLHCKL